MALNLGVSVLPNYFVIGAAKSGTTTLCTLLGHHPNVFMSTPKEIHYFGRSDPEKTREWYEAHFASGGAYRAVGEGSTSYTHPHIVEACAREIAAAAPDARLIYMVRHPLRRLESDWKMRKHEDWAPEGSINVAAREADTTLIGHSLYWQNLSIYRRHFADEQLLVVFLEDFSKAPRRELARCFAHLRVRWDMEIADLTLQANRSQDFRRDTLVARWARSTGLLPIVRDIVPQRLFSKAKGMLTRADRFTPQWDPGVRSWVLAKLRDDARQLLEHCGKNPAFWEGL